MGRDGPIVANFYSHGRQDGTMKRFYFAALALFALFSSVGCCYRPCSVSPHTGLAYGGGWEPMCGGPLDPLGLWGAGNCFNHGCAPTVNTAACYDPCAMPVATPYGTSDCNTGWGSTYPGTYMSQPYMPSPRIEGVPGGGMKPVPDPGMGTPKSQKSANATTYVMPRPLPMNGNVIHRTGQAPWVQAR